jgi:hypothetical protein
MAAAVSAPCLGQCQYEVTAIIEGEEICGSGDPAHIESFDLSDNGIIVGEWHCLLGPSHAFI